MIEWGSIFEIIGKGVSIVAAVAGGWWAVEKWRKRDEHFPRIYFEVTANFIGNQNGRIITELVAILENKGVVPLKITNFTFKLLGLKENDTLEKGSDEIRHQLFFPHKVEEGVFVPQQWEYTFVYPGVKTEYNFVTSIPEEFTFVRMQADFEYLINGRSHHAAKIFKVPKNLL